MSTTPTRWEIRCDDPIGARCRTPRAEISAASLAEVRRALRDCGWHSGPWREWSTRAHLDLCPACVVYVREAIRKDASFRAGLASAIAVVE